jgi:hypothetical protein
LLSDRFAVCASPPLLLILIIAHQVTISNKGRKVASVALPFPKIYSRRGAKAQREEGGKELLYERLSVHHVQRKSIEQQLCAAYQRYDAPLREVFFPPTKQKGQEIYSHFLPCPFLFFMLYLSYELNAEAEDVLSYQIKRGNP